MVREPLTADRDAALDLLRAAALGRVVLWHAFAAPWLTWFAAIPVMFFVAGTLLGESAERASYRSLLRRRARRLLIPLWVYGAIVAGAGVLQRSLAWSEADSLLAGLGHAASWVVPLVDPAGSDWHGGWLSTHLWYLRAYLWVLLLLPVLVMLARRPARSLPVLAFAVLALEAAGRSDTPIGGPGFVLIGDAVTYGSFAVLGIAYRRHGSCVRRSGLAVGAAAAMAAAVIYVAVTGFPAGGINDSYVAVTLTGLAWLFAAGAAERPIRWLAERARVRRMTELITRRALTIYLWHPAAIVSAYALLQGSGRFPRMSAVLHWPAPAVMVLALTVASTALAIGAFGWVEDLAARRPGRVRRVRRRSKPTWRVGIPAIRLMALVLPTAAMLALFVPSMVLPGADSAAGAAQVRAAPRPPSYRAVLGNDAFARRAANSQPSVLGRVDRSTAALSKALERWASGQPKVDSVAVGVAVDGQVWTGAFNKRTAANRLRAQDEFGVLSMTKTFTTALALHQVAANRLSLDAAVPRVAGVEPRGEAADITVRQLLGHTSGLVEYSAAPGYDASRPLSPQEAVQLALDAGLQSTPGTQTQYTNTNFLYLGLVLEEVSGRTYHDLFSELTATHKLQQTTLGPGGEGWPGFSSGGGISTVGDLARWGNALFTGRVLDRTQTDELSNLDERNMALSMWPLCPCGTNDDGTKQYSAIGQHVGFGGLFHFPSGLTLAVRFGSTPDPLDGAIVSLGHALEKALRGTAASERR